MFVSDGQGGPHFQHARRAGKGGVEMQGYTQVSLMLIDLLTKSVRAIDADCLSTSDVLNHKSGFLLT